MTDWSVVVRDAKVRLAELDAERENLLGVVRHAEALAGIVPAHGKPAGLGLTEAAKSRPASRARAAPMMAPTREAVHAILSEVGRPVETRELLPMVRSRGVEVGGKDPVATLSARLSNSTDFQNRRGIGWWFADRRYPGEIGFDEAEGKLVEGQPSASPTAQGREAVPGGGT